MKNEAESAAAVSISPRLLFHKGFGRVVVLGGGGGREILLLPKKQGEGGAEWWRRGYSYQQSRLLKKAPEQRGLSA